MRILRLLFALCSLALGSQAATWYFVSTSCPGGVGSTFSVRNLGNSSWLLQNQPYPNTFAPNAASYDIRIDCPSGVTPSSVTTYAVWGGSDKTCDVCSGAWTAGAPPAYAGPYKFCADVVNNSVIAHTYGYLQWSAAVTNWVNMGDDQNFTLAPGATKNWGLYTSGTDPIPTAILIGRREISGAGITNFVRLGGTTSTEGYWVATASNCVAKVIYDKGGGYQGVPNSDLADALAIGVTNLVGLPRTNMFDNSSQTNSRIGYAAPSGGGLTESTFKTGTASTRGALEDIAAELESIRQGQTNSTGVVGGLNTINNSLTNGSGNSYTAGTNSFGTFTTTGSRGTLSNLYSLPSIPTAVAPSITIALTSLHADLTPMVLNFGDTNVAGWVTTIRAFLLATLTIGFAAKSVGLVGRIVNV